MKIQDNFISGRPFFFISNCVRIMKREEGMLKKMLRMHFCQNSKSEFFGASGPEEQIIDLEWP
jgi:hypothetical protein